MFHYPQALFQLNLKPPKYFQFLNQGMNLSLKTIDQFLCYQFLTEYLKSWFIKDLLSLLIKIIYLYSSQHGFCSRHSTQHAALEILNDLLTNCDGKFFYFRTI